MHTVVILEVFYYLNFLPNISLNTPAFDLVLLNWLYYTIYGVFCLLVCLFFCFFFRFLSVSFFFSFFFFHCNSYLSRFTTQAFNFCSFISPALHCLFSQSNMLADSSFQIFSMNITVMHVHWQSNPSFYSYFNTSIMVEY